MERVSKDWSTGNLTDLDSALAKLWKVGDIYLVTVSPVDVWLGPVDPKGYWSTGLIGEKVSVEPFRII